MPHTKIYLDLSDELQQLLTDNRISIIEILQQQNIEADIIYGVIPCQLEDGSRSKDIVTIILAGSAAFFAIGMAISQVLSVLHRKPYLVQYDELDELRDTKGNILLDETGKPQLKREKRYELLEPRKEDVEKTFEVSWKPKHGLVLKFSSREKQLDTPCTS